MGIKTYQEKNTKPMEKELAQSDLHTSEDKNPKNTIFQESGIFGWFLGFFSSFGMLN